MGERVAASFGLLRGVAAKFKPDVDLKAAGVLFALPALLVNGLLKFSKRYFSEFQEGYYSLASLFVVLAFMALLRIKSMEKVRYWDPGEFGKVVGLDRIPEVKTLREKIKGLSEYGDPKGWSSQLSRYWMDGDPKSAGILYVDGHVRVYHGKKTKLPKRYVAREKLCLRGVTDYWVNDAVGQPFFVVTKEANEGLLKVLRQEIIPRLLNDVPGQPTEESFQKNPYLSRFVIVFDREGYSPKFFKEVWDKHQIACLTYKKYVSEEWPESEFEERRVTYPNGEVDQLKLAQRGTYLGSGKLWVREIRKLSKSGHQTAILSTHYESGADENLIQMLSRWSQENFFKYMMEHYGIDALAGCDLEEIDEQTQVVNPVYRELESRIRSGNGKLSRLKAAYGAVTLDEEIEENKIKKYVKRKSELKEEIQILGEKITELKEQKRKVDKHIAIGDLPEGEKFNRDYYAHKNPPIN